MDTDILVIGGGAGGLWAALSARRHAPPRARITLLDARLVGRTGHTAFSNGWMVVVFPEDDLEACFREIIRGNEWMADQELVHQVLALSYDQMKELERLGVQFPQEGGRYVRRPTRGLKVTRVMHPVGGGLALCWTFREALLREGVQLLDRIFVTDLLKDSKGRVAGVAGIDSRTGEFRTIRARATILATNSLTFRTGFARDITGTGAILAYRAGADIANAEFAYLRPWTPKFYFEGITFAIQDGARFVNAAGEPFMERWEAEWGDEADVQLIARAMIAEKQGERAPVYLDMSLIPAEHRADYTRSKVKWMDLFLRKLDERARIDMFDKTEYFPMYQMTKMGLRTDPECRATLPGLFAAGLVQAGCATHFAGFHIGMCNGSGWIAGRSAAEHLRSSPESVPDPEQVTRCRRRVRERFDPFAVPGSDELLKALQRLMFRYDITMLKHETRLARAETELDALLDQARTLRAPHPHEWVRLHETECMLEAARLIFTASRVRTETRMSHIREDFPQRDDANWLKHVVLRERDGLAEIEPTEIPTPLYPPPTRAPLLPRGVKQ